MCVCVYTHCFMSNCAQTLSKEDTSMFDPFEEAEKAGVSCLSLFIIYSRTACSSLILSKYYYICIYGF